MASKDGNSGDVVTAILQVLAETRRAKEITLEELTALSGIDHGIISRAERLQRIPSMAYIRDLAVCLDLDFADIVKKAEDQVRESRGKKR